MVAGAAILRGRFHDFGRQWGAPDGDRRDSDFWRERLPSLMDELAAGLTDEQRYDAILVDEAQDCADSWLTPVLKALRDPETGGLFDYTDENQRIFPRIGRPPVPLLPLALDHNLRNTRQIHTGFGPLTPFRMDARGGDGPEIRFVPAAGEEALGAADDQVDALLDAGWTRRGLALLTTGHRRPVQVERTEVRSKECPLRERGHRPRAGEEYPLAEGPLVEMDALDLDVPPGRLVHRVSGAPGLRPGANGVPVLRFGRRSTPQFRWVFSGFR